MGRVMIRTLAPETIAYDEGWRHAVPYHYDQYHQRPFDWLNQMIPPDNWQHTNIWVLFRNLEDAQLFYLTWPES